ncbi:MAG: isoprenylcysteine carboxylmethyltransferase family protein [Pseudomonadota bacterium]
MTDMNTAPNKLPLPPLLTVGIIAFAWVFNRIFPFGWDPISPTLTYAGLILGAIAIGIDVWALLTFRRHRANIRPDRPATALITDGPFAFSRNPIYLANVLLTAGLGLALNNRWMLLGAALLWFALLDLCIKREEEHMAAKFGAAWQKYTLKVRRWL